MPPESSSGDDRRIAALHATELLDTPRERCFDELVELAALVCDAPMAALSLVDRERQWFKASVGLDVCETRRDISFCTHAIQSPHEGLDVPDATVDPRFAASPLVTGPPHLRAYFGRVLCDAEGHALGTLCVLDETPRDLAPAQRRGLEMLARQAEAQLELRRSRDRAAEAGRARSQFLVTMSHEIRTPLNGLLGALELALDEDLPAALDEDLATALGAGRQLHTLLNTILDVSKSSARRLELHPHPTCLRELVRTIGSTHIGSARAKGLEFVTVVDSDVPLGVEVDSVRLVQVLGNLVGNALKFTDEGHAALRVTRTANGRVRFSVEDTGSGIAPADQERIFAEFEQASAEFGGTGLGLALARHLVASMGGALALESAEGRGSSFTFELDLTECEHPCEPVAAAPLGLPAARVLLVDDEPVNLRVGGRLLERLGLQVDTAPDGATAIERATSGAYDALILDCYMPDVDGFEVARRVRAAEAPGRRVPILALTASIVEEVRERCLESGMDEVLGKPIDRRKLTSALGRWLAARDAA